MTGPMPAEQQAQLRAIAGEPEPQDQRGWTTGGQFIFDEPEHVPALWGEEQAIAWAAGESLIVAGPEGVGKTTIVQQLALARCGIRPPELLGMTVAVDERPTVYIAADRPRQAARSLRRMVTQADRLALDEHLVVWRGPLPFDLAAKPDRLALFLADRDAGAVVIDSLKDVALDLSKDETGSRVNYALQTTLAAGIEVISNHHDRKSDGTTGARTIADVYGSRWIPAGAGSVLFVHGKPGDPIVTVRHLKQPAGEVGPLTVIHDHGAGTSSLHEPTNLRRLLQGATGGGLTAREAAQSIFQTASPDRNEVEKARRQLEQLITTGQAAKTDGAPPEPVHYRPISTRHR